MQSLEELLDSLQDNVNFCRIKRNREKAYQILSALEGMSACGAKGLLEECHSAIGAMIIHYRD